MEEAGGPARTQKDAESHMGLDLNIAQLVGPGRLPARLDYEVVRELNEADIAVLASKPKGSEAPPLKKITDRHHSLARLLAAGTPENEAAAIVGYDISRVSILKASRAFQELMALYRNDARKEFVSNLEHMSGLSRDALLELRQRVEEAPERLSVNELRQIVIDMSDRVPSDSQLDNTLPTIIELVAPTPPGGDATEPEGSEP